MKLWEELKVLSVAYQICIREIIILLMCVGSVCLIATICTKVIKNKFMESCASVIYLLGIITACVGSVYIVFVKLGIKNIFKLLLAEISGWVIGIIIVVLFIFVLYVVGILGEFVTRKLKK